MEMARRVGWIWLIGAAASLSLSSTAWASWAWVPLVDRVAGADLVVVGKITKVGPGPGAGMAKNDVGILTVRRVLKGPGQVKQVKLLFPSARGGLMHSAMITYKQGQDGGWILRKDRQGNFYTALYPRDYQQPEKLKYLEAAVDAAGAPFAAIGSDQVLTRLNGSYVILKYVVPVTRDAKAKTHPLPASMSGTIGETVIAGLKAADQETRMLAQQMIHQLGMPPVRVPRELQRDYKKSQAFRDKKVAEWWRAKRKGFRIQAVAPQPDPRRKTVKVTVRVVDPSDNMPPVEVFFDGWKLGRYRGTWAAGKAMSADVNVGKHLILFVTGSGADEKVTGQFIHLKEASQVRIMHRGGDDVKQPFRAVVKPGKANVKAKPDTKPS